MTKFTQLEKVIIKCALSSQLVREKKNLRKLESEGKNPFFSDQYWDDIFEVLTKKVEDLSYKHK